ncbi:hypothetical protein AC578_611 [Pseudocercospora eumusae]|uniref:Uncharacterized protein n=1 Tax=Pseudocercospora eumusae TaxID=321146 RepID=A0A139HFG8_9PEZI|nr:hypothetical protein AC578_611 [Pseudocercospora eumusae]
MILPTAAACKLYVFRMPRRALATIANACEPIPPTIMTVFRCEEEQERCKPFRIRDLPPEIRTMVFEECTIGHESKTLVYVEKRDLTTELNEQTIHISEIWPTSLLLIRRPFTKETKDLDAEQHVLVRQHWFWAKRLCGTVVTCNRIMLLMSSITMNPPETNHHVHLRHLSKSTIQRPSRASNALPHTWSAPHVLVC